MLFLSVRVMLVAQMGSMGRGDKFEIGIGDSDIGRLGMEMGATVGVRLGLKIGATVGVKLGI